MFRHLAIFLFIFGLWSISLAAPSCDKVESLQSATRCWYKLKDEFFEKCMLEKGNVDGVSEECNTSALESATRTFNGMNTKYICNGTEIDLKTLKTLNYGREGFANQ